MHLTGNPFVDTGLMVLSTLAGKPSVSELSLGDVRRVFGDGSALARKNQQLKSYTMVFGTNGPLTQPAYRKIKKNETIYVGTLTRLLAEAEREGTYGEPCDLTGIPTNLNFHQAASAALIAAGVPAPESKWIGRDWVPLGGSLGNDAQALPGASRPLHVSALALFALQYLPLGVFLFKGKLTCYQSTAEALTLDLLSTVVERNQEPLDGEILGKGEGSRIVLDFLLTRFERLKEHQIDASLPQNTELLLWLFSNSGAGADCMCESVPDFAIRFAADAVAMGFAHEVRALLAADPKDPRFQLFECIRAMRDYNGLYPFKKSPGVSPEFYEFYQERIRGADGRALAIARKIAQQIVQSAAKSELKEIRKPEFVRSAQGRNRIRRAIADALTLREYDSLFPSTYHPIRVNSSGWDFLRFYLAQENLSLAAPPEISEMKTTHPKIAQIGDAYFAGKGPKKIKSLLDRLARREIGVRWLQDVFCAMAQDKKYSDFNLGSWDEFVCDEDGRPIVFELLFQLRLYLSNKYRESMLQKEMTA